MTKPLANCLLIDDDSDDLEIFEMALDLANLNVHCEKASDGIKGLTALSKMDPLPDYVFLDLNMPHMDGKNCLAKIRSNKIYDEVPVIIYSTSSHVNDIRETGKLGATGFVTKPTDVNSLVEILTRIFSGTYKFTIIP